MLSLADCSVRDQFFRTSNMRNLSSARASHFDGNQTVDSDVFVTLDTAVRPSSPAPSPAHARLHARLHGRTRAARMQADSQCRYVGLGEPRPGSRCRLG